MKSFKNFSVLGIILLSLISSGLFFTAVSAYELQVPLPDGSTEVTKVSGLSDYIKTIYTFGIGFGILLAIFMIVVGGVQYTVSEAISGKDEAKDRITSSVWGLILLLSAALILYILNPQLTTLAEPNVPKIELPSPLPSLTAPSPINVITSCGNKKKESTELCDPTVTPNGCTGNLSCSQDCLSCLPGDCGNGDRDPGERCDYRNNKGCENNEYCTKNCSACIPLPPYTSGLRCGDGLVSQEIGEICDPEERYGGKLSDRCSAANPLLVCVEKDIYISSSNTTLKACKDCTIK